MADLYLENVQYLEGANWLFASPTWMMTFGERAALNGVLAALQPDVSIEVGTFQGGSLASIVQHSEEVHCFDREFPQDVPDGVWLHPGDTHEKLAPALKEIGPVNFALIDGDHSAAGVYRDLWDCLDSGSCENCVILLHDCANPGVRAGINVTLGHPIVSFADVLVPGFRITGGHPAVGEKWGGLFMVMTGDVGLRGGFAREYA